MKKQIFYISLIIYFFFLNNQVFGNFSLGNSFVYDDQQFEMKIKENINKKSLYSEKLLYLNQINTAIKNSLYLSDFKYILTLSLLKIQKETEDKKYSDISYKREFLLKMDNSLVSLYNIPISKKYKEEAYTGTEEKTLSSIKEINEKNKIFLSGDGRILLNNSIVSDLIKLNDGFYSKFKKNLFITSGYRSFREQEALYDNYKYEGKEKFASFPGQSEHILGTAIDFKLNLKEREWFQQNSYKYGFLQSFNKKCELRTGIKEEYWHYRWVGKQISKSFVKEKLYNDFCVIDYLRINSGIFPKEIKESLNKKYLSLMKDDKNVVSFYNFYINDKIFNVKNLYGIFYRKNLLK